MKVTINKKNMVDFEHLAKGEIFSQPTGVANGILWMKTNVFWEVDSKANKNAVTVNGYCFDYFKPDSKVLRKNAELIVEDE